MQRRIILCDVNEEARLKTLGKIEICTRWRMKFSGKVEKCTNGY